VTPTDGTMCPGVELASENKKMSDFSLGKGGRCVWLTTYHPCSAERQENPGPCPTRNPLGHLGLLRDDLYFYCIYLLVFYLTKLSGSQIM